MPGTPIAAVRAASPDKKGELPLVEVSLGSEHADDANHLVYKPVSFLRLFRCVLCRLSANCLVLLLSETSTPTLLQRTLLSDHSTVHTLFAAMQRHSTGRSWPWVPWVQWPMVGVASQPGNARAAGHPQHAWHPAVQKSTGAGPFVSSCFKQRAPCLTCQACVSPPPACLPSVTHCAVPSLQAAQCRCLRWPLAATLMASQPLMPCQRHEQQPSSSCTSPWQCLWPFTSKQPAGSAQATGRPAACACHSSSQ